MGAAEGRNSATVSEPAKNVNSVVHWTSFSISIVHCNNKMMHRTIFPVVQRTKISYTVQNYDCGRVAPLGK
jgi:hypothetical protein